MEEQYYTVEQISQLLDMHPKTIQRYIREGRLKAHKIGKGWRVTGHDLSRFAEGTEETAPAGPEPGLQSLLTRGGIGVSAIVDIPAHNAAEAGRIMNWATALVHSGQQETVHKSLSAQYLESGGIVRILLWGNPRFMQDFMGAIAELDQEN